MLPLIKNAFDQLRLGTAINLKLPLWTAIVIVCLAVAAAAIPAAGGQTATQETVLLVATVADSIEELQEIATVWKRIVEELRDQAAGVLNPAQAALVEQEIVSGKVAESAIVGVGPQRFLAALQTSPTYAKLVQLDHPSCPYWSMFADGFHIHLLTDFGIPGLSIFGIHLRRPYALEIKVVDLGFEEPYSVANIFWHKQPTPLGLDFLHLNPLPLPREIYRLGLPPIDRPWELP